MSKKNHLHTDAFPTMQFEEAVAYERLQGQMSCALSSKLPRLPHEEEREAEKV